MNILTMDDDERATALKANDTVFSVQHRPYTSHGREGLPWAVGKQGEYTMHVAATKEEADQWLEDLRQAGRDLRALDEAEIALSRVFDITERIQNRAEARGIDITDLRPAQFALAWQEYSEGLAANWLVDMQREAYDSVLDDLLDGRPAAPAPGP